MSAPLLIELFTEELPPKALQRLGQAFGGVLHDELKAGGLLSADSKLEIDRKSTRLNSSH